MGELAVLVIDQGTVLDRIDYNIEQVAIKSREATVQLEKAYKIQRSARSLKCIMFLIIAIFILLVIIIMQHANRRRLFALVEEPMLSEVSAQMDVYVFTDVHV